ncbi:MAG: hypothetical protein LAP21_14755 [Acidobacteriia bacterium]|nr:hypothetical protein [Terriglobia bacterium]
MDNSQPKSGQQHEESDLSVGGVVKAAVMLVALGILTFIAAQGLMWGLAKYYADEPMSVVQQQERNERATSDKKAAAAAMQPEAGVQLTEAEKERVMEEMHVAHTFPQPRLQYDDASDMKAMLADEHDKLDSAGKGADGNIHIPIDQAIDALARQGLPPVTGTFTPVNTAPTSVVVPMPAGPGAGAKKQ